MKRSLIAFSLAACNGPADVWASETLAADGRRCRQSEVQVVDRRQPDNCPTAFCTTGTIRGPHGLRGSIDAVFDGFAAAPPTTPEPARTVSFSSVSTITTAQGTLTARETGISSVSALEAHRRFFAGFGEFTGGTGAYAGATGWLMFAGRNFDGTNVTDTMLVQVCLPAR